MDKLDEALRRVTAHANQRRQSLRERHRADVEYVQRNHPEIADWLTTYAALFGRGEIECRVVLKR